MPIRPPGTSTRNISASTAGLSVDRLITQLEITTSTDSSGSGTASICPFRNVTFPAPARAALPRASASISSVMSTPYACPDGPTRRDDSSTSMPPPEPRSSTRSPSFRSATASGFPQPRLAATASAGSPSVSPSRYRDASGPSVSALSPAGAQHPPVSSQHPAASPDWLRTASAAPAYRDRTSSRRSEPVSSFIVPLQEIGDLRSLFCPGHPPLSWHEPRRPPAGPVSVSACDHGRMRILVLGGTRFLGRAIVDAALGRGDTVTIFNRGKSNPSLYPGVETVAGDRTTDLSPLD